MKVVYIPCWCKSFNEDSLSTRSGSPSTTFSYFSSNAFISSTFASFSASMFSEPLEKEFADIIIDNSKF